MTGFGASSDALAAGTVVERFSPKVDMGAENEWVTVWLTEIGISGSGDTLAEARHALVENLGFWLDDIESELATDPTLESVRELAGRAIVARRSGKLAELVFGEADGDHQS
jgi:hypothetical protein